MQIYKTYLLPTKFDTIITKEKYKWDRQVIREVKIEIPDEFETREDLIIFCQRYKFIYTEYWEQIEISDKSLPIIRYQYYSLWSTKKDLKKKRWKYKIMKDWNIIFSFINKQDFINT